MKVISIIQLLLFLPLVVGTVPHADLIHTTLVGVCSHLYPTQRILTNPLIWGSFVESTAFTLDEMVTVCKECSVSKQTWNCWEASSDLISSLGLNIIAIYIIYKNYVQLQSEVTGKNIHRERSVMNMCVMMSVLIVAYLSFLVGVLWMLGLKDPMLNILGRSLDYFMPNIFPA